MGELLERGNLLEMWFQKSIYGIWDVH